MNPLPPEIRQRMLEEALWDFFFIAQSLMLPANEMAKLQDYLDEKTNELPFVEGSKAWDAMKLAGKIRETS